MPEIQSISDHDLLIKLDTKMDGLISEMVQLRDGNAKAIADHENRIRSLEQLSDEQKGSLRTLKWVGGMVSAIVAIVEVIVIYLTRHK